MIISPYWSQARVAVSYYPGIQAGLPVVHSVWMPMTGEVWAAVWSLTDKVTAQKSQLRMQPMHNMNFIWP